MTSPAAIRIDDLGPADDADALALEQGCPQGQQFRIIFSRSSFRRRTESFGEARLLGAWHKGHLIAVGGGAIKDVIWSGNRTKGLLLYDFRVDPRFRRGGVARQLTEALIDWAKTRVEIGYAYAIGDNRAVKTLAKQWINAGTAPAFTLLAYPTGPIREKDTDIYKATATEIRGHYLESRGNVLMNCPADDAFSSPQLVESWRLSDTQAAGCSVWTTREILEEVVDRLPPLLHAASWVLGGNMARRFGLPHVPRLGEKLRSWLVFDSYARDETAARQLIGAVAREARKSAIDHCHLVLPPHAALIDVFRRGPLKAFSPAIPFSIMARTVAGRPLQLPAPVIDPRDI